MPNNKETDRKKAQVIPVPNYHSRTWEYMSSYSNKVQWHEIHTLHCYMKILKITKFNL